MDPQIIARCRAWRPSIVVPNDATRRVGRVLRIVARYHPTRVGLGAFLKSQINDWLAPSSGLRFELGAEPVIQIAYTKAGKPLQVAALRACGDL